MIKVESLYNNKSSQKNKTFEFNTIIRDDDELNRIRQYIINNPIKWQLDIDNPKNNKSMNNKKNGKKNNK